MVYGNQKRRSIRYIADSGLFLGIYHVQYHQPPFRSTLPKLQGEHLPHNSASNSLCVELLPKHEVLCRTIKETENVQPCNYRGCTNHNMCMCVDSKSSLRNLQNSKVKIKIKSLEKEICIT